MKKDRGLLTDFWQDIPYGSDNVDYFSERLEWKGRKYWPKGLEDRINSIHGRQEWGWNYDYMDLPDSDWACICIRRIPSHYTDSPYIEGLNEGSERYIWQRGLVEVSGYYFYNKSSKLLLSLESVIKEMTNYPLKIYFLGEEGVNQIGPSMYRLKDKKGRDYRVVFVPFPKCLDDILSIFHELGHVIADSNNFNHYQQEIDKFEPLLAELQKKFEREYRDAGEDKEKENKIINELVVSDVFQKKTDFELRIEIDAWSAALYLMEVMGVINVFEKGDETLSDIMLRCVKTYIPNELKRTHE